MIVTQSGNSRLASNPLKTLQTPNMGSVQKVIRTNLSSLHNSLGVAQILSVTVGYSQMKKDSVQAVLIQFYTDYISLRVSVTNYPNTIGSVQRLPDDIGLVPAILAAGVCTKPTILAQSGCIHMNIPSAGGRDLNHVNNVHEVQPFPLVSLRVISSRIAAIMNWAVLSPSYFTFSIAFTTSCGTRAFSCCDLLLVELVAITESPCDWCDSVYAKKNVMKGLKCDSLRGNVKSNGAIHHIATPRSARNTSEAFNHQRNGVLRYGYV